MNLRLPRRDGLSLVLNLSQDGKTISLLILPAVDERESVGWLLNAGTSDCSTMPFDLGEFLARAKALVGRGKRPTALLLPVEVLQVDTVRGHGYVMQWKGIQARRRSNFRWLMEQPKAPLSLCLERSFLYNLQASLSF
jgi:CheY-like chemotaxis protein